MIDEKMTWMSKISFEIAIRIKWFQIWLKTNYENDMDKNEMSLEKKCGHTIILMTKKWLL
jgi:hypothetical protein